MQDAPVNIDVAILRRLSEGDEHAFRFVFDRYKAKIYHFILHMLESEAETEEAVQEIFIRIWTSRHKLAAVDNLDNYLFVMARNRGLDYIRRRSAERVMQKGWAQAARDTDEGAGEALDLKESTRLIEAAVHILPPQQARIFRMSKEQGLKRREIAAELGISENTVKSHLQEAMKSIKQYLQDHGDMALLFLLWTRL